jgi:phospholipid transport system transporter-binding protein
MMTVSDSMHRVVGSILVGNAAVIAQQGLDALANGVQGIDMSGVTELDSSGIAVLLAWQRAITAQSLSVSIENIPEGMRKLADVYGVTDFLP